MQRINDFSVPEELVAAGRGIALLPPLLHRRPRRSAARAQAAGRVRAARLVEALLRTGVAERPAVRTVLDALRAEASAVVGGV